MQYCCCVGREVEGFPQKSGLRRNVSEIGFKARTQELESKDLLHQINDPGTPGLIRGAARVLSRLLESLLLPSLANGISEIVSCEGARGEDFWTLSGDDVR